MNSKKKRQPGRRTNPVRSRTNSTNLSQGNSEDDYDREIRGAQNKPINKTVRRGTPRERFCAPDHD